MNWVELNRAKGIWIMDINAKNMQATFVLNFQKKKMHNFQKRFVCNNVVIQCYRSDIWNMDGAQ